MGQEQELEADSTYAFCMTVTIVCVRNGSKDPITVSNSQFSSAHPFFYNYLLFQQTKLRWDRSTQLVVAHRYSIQIDKLGNFTRQNSLQRIPSQIQIFQVRQDAERGWNGTL